MSPELLDQFAEADFVWDGHDLIVSDELQDQKDSYEKIATLLLHCIHRASFSLTRWVKVGQSARMLFRSLLCGVAGLVDLCRQDKAVSMYHLNGFFRAQEDELRYLVVAAFCTYPCESFLAQVMADDRILRFCAQVKGTIDEELHSLKELPTYVWHRIARHVSPDFQSEELRHLVLEASYKSVGYVHKEVFSLLECYPLRLCQGDIAANLEELRRTDGFFSIRRPRRSTTFLSQDGPWRPSCKALRCGETCHAQQIL